MKILLDVNFSPDWVPLLKAAGFESVHWSVVGDPRDSDRTIMAWASTNGYIVFTNDLDFGAILAATQTKAPSVIQIRGQDVLPASIGGLVISVLQKFETALEAGALVSVDRDSARVRILPIASAIPAKCGMKDAESKSQRQLYCAPAICQITTDKSNSSRTSTSFVTFHC